ncbi:MAG: hypothetical protein MUE60_09575 [Candidatus Eisenbacteria bacterium]|nr:hypothetical protein [Candidatus Eisenbacteria bacterium]
MRPKSTIACVVLCIGFFTLDARGSLEARHSVAPRPVSVNADPAFATLSRDTVSPAAPHVPAQPSTVAPQMRNPSREPPGEGTNWVLGQNIQYPSPGNQNRQLGPLCFHNTRKVIAGANDLFIAGWESGSENDNEIMVTSWDTFFGLWTNPIAISQSISDAGRLDLAVGTDGTVHATWHQIYQTSVITYEVFYSRRPAGSTTWSTPVRARWRTPGNRTSPTSASTTRVT